MKCLFLLILLFTSFQVQSQPTKKQRNYLKLRYTVYEKGSTLGLDTLLLLQDFYPLYLESKSRKRYQVFKVQEYRKEGFEYYEMLLKSKTQAFFYVNSYTFDTLFLNINLTQDTLIKLDKLSSGYYTKVSSEQSLLKDIEVGDKISISYAYFDCPQYNSFYNRTFQAINKTACRILTTQKTRTKKYATLKIEALLSLERKVHQLQKGTGLEIQIRKNDTYQVFKCYLKDAAQLPLFLRKLD